VNDGAIFQLYRDRLVTELHQKPTECQNQHTPLLWSVSLYSPDELHLEDGVGRVLLLCIVV
jgi:hypothetical protein